MVKGTAEHPCKIFPASPVDHLIGEILTHGKDPSCIGIDLSGSERKASGLCVLRGKDAALFRVRTDEEIVQITESSGTHLVSIDSSLGLPAGRCCASDSCSCRRFGIMRECERVLRKRGIRVFPTLIPSMQSLTIRGIRLAGILRQNGYTVIESYPGGTQDILGISRKKEGILPLETGLKTLGVEIHCERERVTHDELDALTSAIAGYFFLAGRYESIGNTVEGFLILPNPRGIWDRVRPNG